MSPLQVQEMSFSADVSEEGLSNTPENSSSPETEADASGELNVTNWVVDSSGFLSPTGPVLKEVLDMVDGVTLSNLLYLQSKPHIYMYFVRLFYLSKVKLQTEPSTYVLHHVPKNLTTNCCCSCTCFV